MQSLHVFTSCSPLVDKSDDVYEWHDAEMLTKMWDAGRYGGDASFSGLDWIDQAVRVRYKNCAGWGRGSDVAVFETLILVTSLP